MKNRWNTYLRGGAAITAIIAMSACGPKSHVGDVPHGVGIDKTGCYLTEAPKPDASLADNRTAIFIGLDKGGQISVGYPNEDFRATLSRLATKAEFSSAVAAATAANMTFYPTSDYVPPTPPNPLDLKTASNTTVAFRLSPEAWSFMKDGFSLKSDKHGGFSPFTTLVTKPEGVLLVDYDRTSSVTGKKCVYKYNLLGAITSTNRGLVSRLPIILDPDWGNGTPPAPPGGSPTPP